MLINPFFIGRQRNHNSLYYQIEPSGLDSLTFQKLIKKIKKISPPCVFFATFRQTLETKQKQREKGLTFSMASIDLGPKTLLNGSHKLCTSSG